MVVNNFDELMKDFFDYKFYSELIKMQTEKNGRSLKKIGKRKNHNNLASKNRTKST